ncbi:MAG: HU family DNA-binding protein [Pleurocapsa minor GSE-CHR-MK-17-07R]|jgi:nucleoid DNA-binding protein|nr:HU family DNA-binding protein [Pleurocapsa minor GSE-CHR-MK 17-07R]
MSLNKKKMVREIGRRTRLSNRDVERVIETLVEVWTEELVAGGRIEIEHFLVLETQTIERAANRLLPARRFRRVTVRGSKRLKVTLNPGK